MTGKAAFGVGSRRIHGEGDLVINQPPSRHPLPSIETIDAFALWMQNLWNRDFLRYEDEYRVKMNMERLLFGLLLIIIDILIYSFVELFKYFCKRIVKGGVVFNFLTFGILLLLFFFFSDSKREEG